jgi:hypothetical protein
MLENKPWIVKFKVYFALPGWDVVAICLLRNILYNNLGPLRSTAVDFLAQQTAPLIFFDSALSPAGNS